MLKIGGVMRVGIMWILKIHKKTNVEIGGEA
jgi:hypothetical protein